MSMSTYKLINGDYIAEMPANSIVSGSIIDAMLQNKEPYIPIDFYTESVEANNFSYYSWQHTAHCYAVYMETYNNHIIDYNTFNIEQIAWYDEHQQRLARHTIWLEEFMKDLPFEIRTDM